jgi:predicted O-methyltransferase YrrM
VIELGTNVGISSAFIGAALTVNGDSGKLVTLDASPYRQRLARQLHSRLGLRNVTYTAGLFNDTLESVLERSGHVDLAFIDGHHQYQPTLDYLDAILQQATVDCAFVFDDIRWSDGMKQAWTEIMGDPRFGLVMDLGSIGVCIRGDAATGRFVSEQFASWR